MKYAWIKQQRDGYTLEDLCSALGVSPSGYHHWRVTGGSGKRLSDAVLLALIRSIHAETKGAYGAPRVWRELRDRGYRTGKERVRKLMQAHSDRGSQYCSHDYRELLKQYGMTASMSRKGNCWGNAVTEGFWLVDKSFFSNLPRAHE